MTVKDILTSHKQGYYKPGKFEEGNLHFIRISDINDNFYLDKESTPMINVDQSDIQKFNIKKGDFLFARTGGAGRFCLITEDIKGIFASYLIRFRFNEQNDSKFLRYFFMSDTFQNELKSKIHGGVNQNVHAENIKVCKVPNIELSKQKQIVQILDQAFEAIDQAQSNLEKNIANAKELFQSKLNEIFSQKGEGWEEKTLGELGQVQTGTTPPTKDKSNYGNYIPFVKPAHFQKDGSIDSNGSMLSPSGLKKGRLISANSILMVCIGATIGKTGFTEIPVSSNQQINALTPNKSFQPKFLYYTLISPIVQNQISQIGKSAQATLPIINKSKWRNLKVNIPLDKETQQSIINNLDKLNNSSTEIIKAYKLKINSLEELKKSLLQKAFAGELTSTSSVNAKKEVAA